MKRRPGPPTKFMLMLVALLVAGAIVNVAVAWVVGFHAGPPAGTAAQRLGGEEADQLWNAYVDGTRRYGFAGWRGTRLARTSTVFGDCFIIGDDGTMVGIGNALSTGVFIVDSGLPCRVLRHVSQWGLAGSKVRFATRKLDRDATTWLKEARPLWPGFAINTVFYAFIVWLLVAVPFALRRRRRIKRGLCPRCAYPVGTNEVCTECGVTVLNVRAK